MSFSKKKQNQNNPKTCSQKDIDFRSMMEPVARDHLGIPNPMRGKGIRLRDARGYSTTKELRWGDSGRYRIATNPSKKGYGNYSRYPSEPNHHTVLEFLEHEVGIRGWEKQSEHLVKLGLLSEDMLPNRRNGGGNGADCTKAPEVDPAPDAVDAGALDEDDVAEEDDVAADEDDVAADEDDEARPLTPRDIAYDYVDEQGTLLFRVVRHTPKAFSQRRPRPGNPGKWIKNLDGVRKVLFRLPELIETVKLGRLVVIVEGEKDVVCLASAGVIGTTAPGGTSSWLPEFNEVFRNADVLLIPDCDKPDSKSMLGERNSK